MNLDKVEAMFQAVESGDVPRFRSCFEPDATIWHNTDELDVGLDAVSELIGAAHAQAEAWRYTDRRTLTVGNVAIVQHVLNATFKSGDQMHCPTMMRIDLSDAGLITRIEEYFDSRDVDSLGNLFGGGGAE